MLQINSGKFFRSDDLYRTTQRGVLHSNYDLLTVLETDSGRLLPTTSATEVSAFVYEVEQRLEAKSRSGQQEVLVAVSPDVLQADFAAVLSFVLGVTCSRDAALVRRLTRGAISATPGRPPRDYVARVFDSRVQPRPEDGDLVRQFLSDLIGLSRSEFVTVMRAVRRYVIGLQRIGDDLELAYTLLVASLESLAQNFDSFVPDWEDLDDRKRRRLDKALEGADAEVAGRVRRAVLDVEHVALSRRFREFVLAHLPPSFFREDADDVERPISRLDLPRALDLAYRMRSKQVHVLEELPRLLTRVPSRGDVMMVERRSMLTFQGLARVTRAVIYEVVARQPKVQKEDFDYRSNLPGLIRAPAAPQYWIWKRQGYNHRTAVRYLEGFLTQLVSTLTSDEKALTDIREVLEEIENKAPGLAPESRLPMLALYIVYHRSIVQEWHRPGWEDFAEQYLGDFEAPSPISLFTHVMLRDSIEWNTLDLTEAWGAYMLQRHHKNGFRAPALLETATLLTIAERYQQDGDPETALDFLGRAVETQPGDARLLELETKADSEGLSEIEWPELLLP